MTSPKKDKGESMGIINIVANIKEIYAEYITLVKVGNFFYCYGRDSYIISYLFNYKINILEKSVYSCAFPNNAYNNYFFLFISDL